MIRVNVIAASEVVRAGLEAVVRSSSGLEVGDESAADVLLLDGDNHEGEDTVLPAVLLTDHPNPPAGFAAVLPKSATRVQIIAAIYAAAAGLIVFHPDTAAPTMAHRDAPSQPVQPLTEREIQVLGMLSQGLPNKTIAWKLGISEHTVKFHVSSIFSKLNVSTRTEAVTLGARLGLVLL